jgi:hypothetical protein
VAQAALARIKIRDAAERAARDAAVVMSNTMIPVVDEGQNYLGHVIRRGPADVEAFNVADVSLGLFQDEREEAAEVWRRRRSFEDAVSPRRCIANATGQLRRRSCP